MSGRADESVSEERVADTQAEAGLDFRLAQIEQAIGAAEAWLEKNEAEVMGERLMSRDPWDEAYSQLQERGMAETRETVERLKAERERIEEEDAKFGAWCKEVRDRGGWD